MKICVFVLFVGFSAASAQAQRPATPEELITLCLKDGRTITTPAVRLSGHALMATVTTVGKGEIGYSLDTLVRVDFPKPPRLKVAVDLLAQNKAAEALALIEPVVTEFAPLKEVPGNWWAQAALLKLDALHALQREREALALMEELARSPLEPETLQSVRVQQAASCAGQGDHDKAIALFDSVIGGSKNPAVLARAWTSKGQSLLAQRKWEPALFCYLHVPVFYPEQKFFLPAVHLGSARALLALGDASAAQDHLQALIDSQPDSPEAASARIELDKLHKQQP